jgi:hypothetical protein
MQAICGTADVGHITGHPHNKLNILRGGPLEKGWGGGQKNSRKGKQKKNKSSKEKYLSQNTLRFV